MKSKTYDVLKMLGQIVLPALLTFIGVCGKELRWTNIDIIMKIGTAFITMWNSIIVIWNANYKSTVQENKEA